MVSRRELLSGGVLSLAGAGVVARPVEAALQDIDLKPVSDALKDIRDELALDTTGLAVRRAHISRLREIQKLHFRSHGRFPAWIEVGIDVWESVHDWHIRNQVPLVVNRESPSRVTIQFFFTTIIGRGDIEPNYIGAPYDER